MKEGRTTKKGTTPGGRPYHAQTDKVGAREVTRIEVGKGAGKTTGRFHSKTKDTAFSPGPHSSKDNRPTKANSFKAAVDQDTNKGKGAVRRLTKSFTKPTKGKK